MTYVLKRSPPEKQIPIAESSKTMAKYLTGSLSFRFGKLEILTIQTQIESTRYYYSRE